MYFQITTKCNMACEHCCFSCNNDGVDMPLEVFQQGIKKFKKRILNSCWWFALGGGEPTVHPQFWKFFAYALSQFPVWLATNGKKKQDALTLCDLAKKRICGVRLSLDDFHEPISQVVANKFKKGLVPINQNAYFVEYGCQTDSRTILTVLQPYTGGRWRDGVDHCLCVHMMVTPNGDVYPCGCEDAPKIGDIYNGITDERFKDYPTYGMCYKYWLKIQEKKSKKNKNEDESS